MTPQFISSDFHFGCKRLEIMDRPFRDDAEMFATIKANHNRVVKKTDQFLFLGDIVDDKADDPEHWLKMVGQLNSVKTICRGNHDRIFTDKQLLTVFDKVIPEGEGVEFKVEGIPCYGTHYPTCGRQDLFNCVAHIHRAWLFQLNMLNCGVCMHNFRPVPISKIPFYFKAIHDFYDDDAFCAYNEINEAWRGLRGKKGSRFPLENEIVASEDATIFYNRQARKMRIINAARTLYDGDGESAIQWGHTPRPSLGNNKPFDLVNSEEETQQVLDLIARIEQGIVS